MEHTAQEKMKFFAHMDKLIEIANGFSEKPPKSTIAKMNDLLWIKRIIAPETLQAERLLEEWILKNRVKKYYYEKH